MWAKVKYHLKIYTNGIKSANAFLTEAQECLIAHPNAYSKILFCRYAAHIMKNGSLTDSRNLCITASNWLDRPGVYIHE